MSRLSSLRLSLPLCVVLLAGGVAAQSADEHFTAALEAYKNGDNAAAIEHLKALLADNPSSEQALKLWDSAEKDLVTHMLLERGELGALADRFLGLARVERQHLTEDPGSAKDVVARVLDGDPIEREKALLELRAKFGPWAVPALVGPLGDRSNPDHRVSAVQALVRLGSDAGLPLIATLQSDDVTTRRNAAAVLGTLKDNRAAAALALVARDDADETTRSVAADALSKLNPSSTDPVALARSLAEGWFHGDSDLVQPWSSAAVVWEWKDGALAARRVMAGLYPLELAEQNARLALEHGGGDTMRPMLAAIHAAMKAEITAAGRLPDMQGNELLTAAAARIPALDRDLALAGSFRGKALVQCLANKQRDVSAALVLMDSMGASPEERQGLKAALQDAEAPVAIGAAMALARQGDTDPAIVTRLASALGTVPDRVVVAIGATGLTGQANGWQLLACDGVQEGLMRAKSLPPKDVIVVQDGVQGVTLDTMVFALKNDPRSANVPLVIVTKDVNGVTALYGAKAAKVVGTCGFADVASVAGPRDAQQADLVARARAAADALAQLPANVARGAAGDVARTLAAATDADLRASLVHLAGRAAIEEALPSIEAIVVDDTAAPELRKEALLAAARLWAVHGGAVGDADRIAGKLIAMVQGSDATLSMPAAQALGQLHGVSDKAMAGAVQ